MTITQCLVWFTYSSEPTAFQEYFGIDTRQVDLLLNWGPIFFVPVSPLVSWLLASHNGIRRTMLVGTSLMTAGALLRLVPCFLAAHSRRSWLGHAFLHAGQILNACAGPTAMNPVSLLSATWFPERERTTATAVAFLANGAGVSVGFLLGPAVVRSAATAPNLFYIEAGIALLPLVLIVLYFPNKPPVPPCIAAVRTPPPLSS
jgi:FLVCR family MFS transporter